MSSFQVLRVVSEALRKRLFEALREDEDLRQLIDSPDRIGFDNPTESLRQGTRHLSLWLYKIDPDQFTRNAQPTLGPDGTTLQGPPLTLSLSYLITPLAGQANDLLLLGRVLQLFHEQPEIPVIERQPLVLETLRVHQLGTSLEEITRIWEALREPYRLSAAYQIRLTHLGGRERVSGGQIVDRRLGTPP